MSTAPKPAVRPHNPCFSSGPCAKRPGWSSEALAQALVGRSHRSKPGRARLGEVIERSRKLCNTECTGRVCCASAAMS